MMEDLMKIFLIATMTLSTLLSANLAFAEHHKGACKEDAKKLCAGVKPGHGNILKCMKEHAAELSPECKENIETPVEKRHELI
jgi:hypothetical protein